MLHVRSAALVAVLWLAQASLAGPLTLVVDPGQRYQTIDNFGASGAWSCDPIGSEWTLANKERLADLLFSRERGIGLSLWRFNIGAGSLGVDKTWDKWGAVGCFKASADAPYDWTRQAGQQWFLRAARARGVEQLLAFTNSPPVWLTANGHAYSSDRSRSTNLRAGAEPQFARFLADVLAHFRDEGLPFDYLSPVNEPNWEWKGGQEGCRYGNDDILRLARALHSELGARGLRTQLSLCEAGNLASLLDDDLYRQVGRIGDPAARYKGGNNSLGVGRYGSYLRALLGDPELRAMVGGAVSAHCYGSDTQPSQFTDLRAAVRQNLDRYLPGARYWMSEYCVMDKGRDLGMDTALKLARSVHADLAVANASAWHWWLAISPYNYKDGLIYTDYHDRGVQNILPAKMLWVLGNYSRFVRPGARRVALAPATDHDDLLASAYLNADQRLAVVLVNAARSDQRLRLALGGQVSQWTPYVTDATRDLAAGAPLAVTDEVLVPARAVVTLLGDWQPGGEPVTWPAAAPLRRERAGGTGLYLVQCGAAQVEREPAATGRCHSLADQPLGEDPRTGYRWGYSSFGESRGFGGGSGPFASVRYDDGDRAGQGLTYSFEVPAQARLRVSVGFHDPWPNAGRAMDVLVAGTLREQALVPGQARLEREYRGVVAADGVLQVVVRRAAIADEAHQDPLVSWIRVGHDEG